jgi:hypothetical protein
MLVIPVASAIDVSIENKTEKPISIMQDFTHTVFVEYATLTTCPPCVTASAQLYSIYNSGDLDFYFVSLVANEGNMNVRGRVSALGVVGVPDVFFDGGFKRLIGGQGSEGPYRSFITQSGERDVPDMDITMDVTWLGNGDLKIEGTVVNNEAEEFNARIRTFVVEKESRWNDYSGKPYHFAALDIPIDKKLAVANNRYRPLGETYTFSKTWRGSRYGFEDIEQDNIMVLTVVYDIESDHVIESAFAEPTTKIGNLRPMNLLFLRLFERFQIFERIFCQ